MNEDQWEEFWAHLVGDHLIVDQMGTNHLDSVGASLEWKRQEFMKYHHKYPDCGITKAGRKFISEFTTKGDIDEN